VITESSARNKGVGAIQFLWCKRAPFRVRCWGRGKATLTLRRTDPRPRRPGHRLPHAVRGAAVRPAQAAHAVCGGLRPRSGRRPTAAGDGGHGGGVDRRGGRPGVGVALLLSWRAGVCAGVFPRRRQRLDHGKQLNVAPDLVSVQKRSPRNTRNTRNTRKKDRRRTKERKKVE